MITFVVFSARNFFSEAGSFQERGVLEEGIFVCLIGVDAVCIVVKKKLGFLYPPSIKGEQFLEATSKRGGDQRAENFFGGAIFSPFLDSCVCLHPRIAFSEKICEKCIFGCLPSWSYSRKPVETRFSSYLQSKAF